MNGMSYTWKATIIVVIPGNSVCDGLVSPRNNSALNDSTFWEKEFGWQKLENTEVTSFFLFPLITMAQYDII